MERRNELRMHFEEIIRQEQEEENRRNAMNNNSDAIAPENQIENYDNANSGMVHNANNFTVLKKISNKPETISFNCNFKQFAYFHSMFSINICVKLPVPS